METTADTAGYAPPAASAPRAPHTLEDLLDLDADTLAALYRNARVPQLDAVAGDLRGRMLAVTVLSPAVAPVLRALARTAWFPWRGKSFRPLDAARGEGINRVISDRWRWFRFETFVGLSRAGNFDAVQLDYDNPGNPFFIRAIKDEIREIAPNLYLGQAYAQVAGKEHLVLYFALAG